MILAEKFSRNLANNPWCINFCTACSTKGFIEVSGVDAADARSFTNEYVCWFCYATYLKEEHLGLTVRLPDWSHIILEYSDTTSRVWSVYKAAWKGSYSEPLEVTDEALELMMLAVLTQKEGIKTSSLKRQLVNALA